MKFVDADTFTSAVPVTSRLQDGNEVAATLDSLSELLVKDALDDRITALRGTSTIASDEDEFTLYVNIGNTDLDSDGDQQNGVGEDDEGFNALHKRVAAVNSSIDMSGSGQRRNTEVHFKPSITLENGVTFAARIEFEGDSAAGVDRSYMDISSDSLGMIRIGSHPSMGYGMIVAAPGVGLGINSGAHPNFIPVGSQSGAAYSSNNEVGGNWEAMRVSYMTPSLAGLTIGVSYAADGRGGGNSANHTGFLTKAEEKDDLSDIMDIGAKFTQSLGEMNVTLSARYGTAQLEGYDKKPRETAVGAQIGFGAFTVGGAYADSQRPADARTARAGVLARPTQWTRGRSALRPTRANTTTAMIIPFPRSRQAAISGRALPGISTPSLRKARQRRVP